MEFIVQHRDSTGKQSCRKLRDQGLTPGILYGKGKPVQLSFREDHARRMLLKLRANFTVLTLLLETEGKQESKKAIVREYQIKLGGKRLQHIDFLEVGENTLLTPELPIHISGTAEAVTMGGVLQLIRHNIPVTCKVKDLVKEIVVDVSKMDFGDTIHVMDLEYPEGIQPIVKGRNYTLITVGGKVSEEEDSEVVEESSEETEESQES